MPDLTSPADHQPNTRIRELEALNAVATAVGHSLDLEAVVREAINQVLVVTNAGACAVYLREPRSRDLVLARIEGVSGEFARDPDIRRIPAGVGWWGQMAHHGRPIILEDIGALSRPSRKAVVEEGLQSAAYVPLKVGEQLSGAIVIGSRHPRKFNSVNLEFLAAIGEQIGVAVENARLYTAERTRVRQLALISEVGRSVADTLNVEELLEQVVKSLQEDFGYQDVAVLLLDSAGEMLELQAVAGTFYNQSVGEYRQSVSQGIIGRCARTGEVALSNDVTRDPDYFCAERGKPCGAEVSAPIKAAGRVMGVLDVQSDSTHAFDENDVVVIQTLADQCGVALQNAQLFRRQEQQLAKLQTLDEIARTVSSSLNLDEALDRILVELQRVVAYDSAAVWLADGDHPRSLAARKHGSPAPDMKVTLPASDPFFEEGKRTGQPVILEDARTDPRFKGIGNTGDVRGWVLAPLAVRDEIIGCLTVDSHTVGAYDAADAQTIMTFARHAAVALENARLYAQTRHQLEALTALHEISIDLLSRRRLEDVLEDIVRQACDLVGATGSGIYLYDAATEQIALTVAVGLAEEFVGRVHFAPGEGLAGRVVQTGEPISVDDYATWEGRAAQYMGVPFRASISAPLKYEERILGALSISESRPGRTFDEADVHLLSLLAGQAAVALENARLYEELERLATQDGLTGLYNHRRFHELLEQEVARADRYDHPLALLLIDLDGFKGYNDWHGHVAGDGALRGITALLQQSCRRGDHIARYGGEEFAVILPETPAQEAVQVAERIRSTVETRTQQTPFLSCLTVSIGVASYPEDAGTASGLLIAADGRMYQAKARGKNQVASATGV